MNIVGRKMKGKPPAKREFRFSLETLNRIFKILFFADPDSAAHRGAQVLDNSQRSIAVVSKVLNRISMMPLQMPEQLDQLGRAQGALGGADQQINLLKLYQAAGSTEDLEEHQSKRPKRPQSQGGAEAPTKPANGKMKESSHNIVTMKISQILSMCMQSFHDFIMSRFAKLSKEPEQKRSVLSTTSKREKTELA